MRCIFFPTASYSWNGGNGGRSKPGTMANTAGHLCCSADHELPYGPPPCSSGDVEDEACASDLTAWLSVSQTHIISKAASEL